MRKIFLSLCLVIVSIGFGLSCSKSNTPDAPPLDCSTVTNKNFGANINPIVQSTCNQPGCHDVASVNGPGPLTNYTQVFNARAAIRPAIASGLMPQNRTLSIAEKNSILCWIDSGAPNN
jgi:hypothetical protein